MPRRPIKARKINQELTEEQLNDLIHGWTLDDVHNPYYKIHGRLDFPWRDDAHRRETYFKHREYLFSLAGKGPIDGLFGELEAGKKPSAYYTYEEENKG